MRATISAKVKAASRLSACAEVLRLAVEVGLGAIRYKKTVKDLLEHIIQTLPSPDGHFVEPIARDYIKALRTILSHQPHAEHIEEEQWRDLVTFCNDSIRFYSQSRGESDSQSLAVRNGSSRSRASRSETPASVNGSFAPIRKSTKTDSTKSEIGQNLDELMLCLSYLLSVPHAEILESSQATLDSLFEFLQETAPQGRPQSQEAAFECISTILSTAVMENVELATWILKAAVTQIRRLWSSKNPQSLKESMLMVLVYGERLIPRLLQHDVEEDRNELERLLDVLRSDYLERLNKDLLSIDDFDLNGPDAKKGATQIFSNASFRLRTGNRESESSWSLLESIALIFTSLYLAPRSVPYHEDIEGPKKRRKIEEPINDLLDDISLSSDAKKLAAIQVFVFVSTRVTFTKTTLQCVMDYLVPLLTSRLATVSNWSTLAMTW